MFSKILIANRGEIAVRIIRACKEMGVATVAVYSEADRNALHVALADQSYCIGGNEAHESYLNENQIISTAILAGAQAIHPGYGFLSENAHFARLCRKNGLVFIGPEPESMERLSDKAILKELIRNTGLSVIPGTKAVSSVEEARRAADRIGYPVMLKASAGGGGRGIRLIRTADDLEEAYLQATSEAISAFGDGSVYLEKYIFPARHVELQILADEHGNAVCLGDRDCSLQRRNQKLVEETPSPAVNDEQRSKIIGLAVKWHIRIAAGIPLGFTQKDISFQGSAIECRINAGSCGTLQMLHVPGGPSVRFDTCLIEGTVVSPYYDSLLGKLIVYAKTREETLRKMRAALCELVIEGIPTNIEEQLRIVEDERFTSGNYDLTFMGNR